MKQEMEQRLRLLGFGVQLTLVGIAVLLSFGKMGLVLVFVGTVLALGGVV